MRSASGVRASSSIPATSWPDRHASCSSIAPTDGYHFVVALNAAGAFGYYGGGRWAPGFTVRLSDFNADGISDVMLYDAATGLAFQVHTLAPGVYAYYSSTWATGFSTIVTRPD